MRLGPEGHVGRPKPNLLVAEDVKESRFVLWLWGSRASRWPRCSGFIVTQGFSVIVVQDGTGWVVEGA